ncbi:MAG: hypothetical protein K2P84_01600, partial [Undibacterium sp.]|nr:hypothetical protein [Undibacterium sp.]
MSTAATLQQAQPDARQTNLGQATQLTGPNGQVAMSDVQRESIDKRPQVLVQCRLQEISRNSPQSRQLQTYQQMMERSERTMQLKTMGAIMNPVLMPKVEEKEALQTRFAVAQGRVKPTMQMKSGITVNDDAGLEQEADVMGAKAIGIGEVQMYRKHDTAMFKM